MEEQQTVDLFLHMFVRNSLSSCARKLEGLFFCKLIGSFVAFVFLKAKGEYLSGQLEHASE